MKEIYYVINSPSFGDTLAATPTLRYLSQSHQSKISVVTHNTHIFKNNPHVDRCISFLEFEEVNKENIIKYESFTNAGKKDGNGIEKKFAHIDLRQIHAFDLGFQLMPHQMEYDFYPDPVDLPYELPETYVVCHITQNWPNRTWSTENWQDLIDLLSENKIFTVLIGKNHFEKVHNSISVEPIEKKCPKLNNLYGLDLSNKLDLDSMFHIINKSSILITMCSGPIHIGGCTDTHILQIGSAQNPLLRAPYRKGSQEYKYDFVGGTCSIFCNMDLRYNVLEWGDINSVPPLTDCREKKPTFECHPKPLNVFNKIIEVLSTNKENFHSYLIILPSDDKNKINFNFRKTLNSTVKIEAVDVNTGLKRDKWEGKCDKLSEGNYWWAPSPGRLENLGDVILKLFIDGVYVDEIIYQENGGKKLIIKDKEYYLDKFDDYNYSTFWEIFIHNEYELDGNSIVDENDTILDIGANFGFFAMYATNKGAKQIYCVEPFPSAFQNIKSLSSDLPIIPINKAVTSKKGDVYMSIAPSNSATNCLSDYNEIFNNSGDQIIVQSLDINTLINEIKTPIDLLKIDCEGCELDIFENIETKNLVNIKKFVIETHSESTDSFIRKKLYENGFNVYNKGNILFAFNQ